MKQEELIALFKDSGALLEGHFKLTSGRHSDIYYEKFTLLRKPAICTRICEEMANKVKAFGPVSILGPTTGGLMIAYDVARYLGLEALYAEPGDDGRILKRGMELKEGQKVAIVDDVLTTGGSIFECINLAKKYQADIVGISVMLDRSNGQVTFDYPYEPVARVSANNWKPSDCPICAKGEPLTQRGSRKF